MFYRDGLRSIHIFIHENLSIKKKKSGNILKDSEKNHTNVLFQYTILANQVIIVNKIIYYYLIIYC